MSGASNRSGAVKLRFCPNSNDLLYPKEDRERKRLVYACQNCEYEVDARDHCVYRHNIHHTSAEATTIIQDVRTDPHFLALLKSTAQAAITAKLYFSR